MSARYNTQPTVWRRLFHASFGSSIPISALAFSSSIMIKILLVLLLVATLIEFLRLRYVLINHNLTNATRHLLKIDESSRITGATYMIIAALIVFLLFDKSIAIMGLFFLSIGDPVAAIVGVKIRRFMILKKSLAGTTGFVVASLGVVALLTMSGAISFHWGLVLGAIVAGIVELCPSIIDDNLTIPLISCSAMTVVGVSGVILV